MLKTARQYIESLRNLKLNLYLLGEKVEDWAEFSPDKFVAALFG